MGGRDHVESVTGFDWNHWPESMEYADCHINSQVPSDCGGKIMPVGGLLEKVHFLAKDTMRFDDVGDIPGHKQAIDVRGDGKQVFCKVAAVHPRHDHIGYQQIN